jgi:ABC-type dipeptide/oligopeptide/nickel transport system permease component
MTLTQILVAAGMLLSFLVADFVGVSARHNQNTNGTKLTKTFIASLGSLIVLLLALVFML